MTPTRRGLLLFVLAALPLAMHLAQQSPAASANEGVQLPNVPDSFKFAVIGDSGTGGSAQRRVADQMAKFQKAFPFKLVIMVGDNMYGGESASDFRHKFEQPYADLLKSGVEFYAALGNHDDPSQRNYKLFHMGGERYYTFRPAKDVRFFALDSSYLTPEQLEWLEKELKQSDSEWKIPFFHHPLYSSAEKHGSELELRKSIEPIFLRSGVDVVFAGHDHVYERIKPQHGITYFVVGDSAKLREGDLAKSAITAVGFDEGYSFLMAEIDGDVLSFQTISDRGKTIDFGRITARKAQTATSLSIPEAGVRR
jgi:hypothetical protein